MPFKSASAPKRKAPARRMPRRRRAPARKRVARKRVSAPMRSIQGQPGGITTTSVVSGRYKSLSKGLSKLGAPAYYQLTRSGDLGSSAPTTPTSGRQCPVILGQWNSVADVFNLAANVPAVVTTFAVSPTRFHLHSIKGIITMNNPTSQTMVVDLYEICAKRDIPTNSATSNPYSVGLPTTAWETSLTQQSVSPVLSYAASTQLGAVPTDGQLFKDYYRIVAKKTVVLPQNATHEHSVLLKLDKNFDKGELDIQRQYLFGFQNFSHYTMAVVRGQPCYDTESTKTTTIAPALRWVVSEHYQYSWVQASGSINTFSDQIPSATVGNEKVIQLNNPQSGPVIGV